MERGAWRSFWTALVLWRFRPGLVVRSICPKSKAVEDYRSPRRWREVRVPQSSEKSGDRLCLDKFARLIEVVQNDRVRIDSQRVVDRGEHLGRMDRILGGR